MKVDLTTLSALEEAEARGSTRASVVYAMLRRDIVHGLFHPGEKLRIENLAERYGVGATPVREALNRLSSEGLVSQQDQKGFRVSPVSKEELLELTRTRAWVTEITLRESIAHGDQAWEENIVLTFHRLSRTPYRAAGDLDGLNPEWEQHHHAFHDALIAACPSRPLLEFSARLFDAADRYRNLATSRSASKRDVMQEHRDLMDAVVDRRTADAIALLNEHTQRTTDRLLRVLEEANGIDAGTVDSGFASP